AASTTRPALGHAPGAVARVVFGRAATRHLTPRRPVHSPERAGVRAEGDRAVLRRPRVPDAAGPRPARRPRGAGGRSGQRARSTRRHSSRLGPGHPTPAVLVALPGAVR